MNPSETREKSFSSSEHQVPSTSRFTASSSAVPSVSTNPTPAAPSVSANPTPSGPRIQYQVLHGYFKWTIENFSGFPSASDKHCSSPVFDLKKIWWELTLHPRVTNFGIDKISINLIRHKSDHGPEKVSVSYKLGLENHKNKVWFQKDERILFGKGDCHGFQTPIFGHLEDFLSDGLANNNDALSVLCEIYVQYGVMLSTDPAVSKKTKVNLDLPNNLINFFKSEQLTDALIEIPGGKLRAHKSILYARSRSLARKLQDGSSVIQISCSPPSLICALVYMYCGDFDYLAKNCVFSIGLYELARKLSLYKLENLLTPHKIELKSKINVEKIQTVWILHKFKISSIFYKDVTSGTYYDKSTGIGIRLCIKRMIRNDYIDFQVEVSGIIAAIKFSFEMYLLDYNDKPVALIPATVTENPEASFKDSNFTYCVNFSAIDVIKSTTFDEHLYIKLMCKRYSLMHLPSTSECSSVMPSIDTDTWLDDLSTDLCNLYETSNLSDVTLRTACGHPFRAHRTILAARSEYFHEMFKYDQMRQEFSLPDEPELGPRIVNLVLSYIYGSKFLETRISESDIISIYGASQIFQMSSLRLKCRFWLSSNVNPRIASAVLKSAMHYNDEPLTTRCKNYIRSLKD